MSESNKFDPKSLDDLLAKVQAATGPDRELDGLLALHVAGWSGGAGKAYWTDSHGKHRNRPPEWSASIDAALSLTAKMLPGVGWYVARGVRDGVPSTAAALFPDLFATEPMAKAEGATPPLAILAALLSSLKAST